MKWLLSFLVLSSTAQVFADDSRAAILTAPDPRYFVFFLIPLGVLLLWSGRRIRTAAEFYASGRDNGGIRNGLAITGDYLSAASFLGIAGMIALSGYHGLLYAVGFFAGWPLILVLFAERLRRLGRFTLTDILAVRLQRSAVARVAMAASVPVVVLYLAAQLVAAGHLAAYLFSLPYIGSVVVIGIMTALLGIAGGLLFSTRAQVVKAVVMLLTTLLLVVMGLLQADVDITTLFASDHRQQPLLLATSALQEQGALSQLSLGVALLFGTAGLPHVLTRFFSVADPRRARMSVFYATGFIGGFYLLTFVVGYAALRLLDLHPEMNISVANNGGNLVALQLALGVGGPILTGLLAAVLFVVLISVMTALLLSGASAISHDWYAVTVNPSRSYYKQRFIHSSSVVGLILFATLVAILMRGQNVAYIVGLAFAIAASVSFPLLTLALYWKGLTTRGAVIGGGLSLSVVLLCIVFGPAIWVDGFGFSEPIFAWSNPALLSVTIGFVAIVYFSLSDRSELGANERQQEFSQLD